LKGDNAFVAIFEEGNPYINMVSGSYVDATPLNGGTITISESKVSTKGAPGKEDLPCAEIANGPYQLVINGNGEFGTDSNILINGDLINTNLDILGQDGTVAFSMTAGTFGVTCSDPCSKRVQIKGKDGLVICGDTYITIGGKLIKIPLGTLPDIKSYISEELVTIEGRQYYVLKDEKDKIVGYIAANNGDLGGRLVYGKDQQTILAYVTGINGRDVSNANTYPLYFNTNDPNFNTRFEEYLKVRVKDYVSKMELPSSHGIMQQIAQLREGIDNLVDLARGKKTGAVEWYYFHQDANTNLIVLDSKSASNADEAIKILWDNFKIFVP